MTRLLDDLLDLSFLESGQVILKEQTSNLRDILDRAVASAGVPQSEDGLRVLRTPAAENVMIRSDTDRLSQVFINLISNAHKYCTAAQPALTITVTEGNGQVDIDFVDNGKGIPRGQQDNIFEKFYRLSDYSSAGSAGLGLAICKEVMARLGGTISYVPGQAGTAFRVSLPVERVTQAA